MPPETTKFLHATRTGSLANQGDQNKESTRGYTVGHHQQNAAFPGSQLPGRQAKHDQTKVGDRRISEQTFDVILMIGAPGGMKEPNQGQHTKDRQKARGRIGEERESHANQTVDAGLQQQTGQIERTRSGGLGQGIGQPGMERHQR